jgi:hypothetical protein
MQSNSSFILENPMLKFLLDTLTYPDLAGKRHLRWYAKATLVILVGLGAVSVFGAVQYDRMMAGVVASPEPLVTATLTLEPVTATALALLPTHTPVPTAIPVPTATELPCPLDPEQWVLADAGPENNLKKISPACVYDGLARTISWVLAISEGYSRQEAADELGFDGLPIIQSASVMAMTDTKGPVEIPVNYTPPLPDFRQWRFGFDEQPSVRYSLRGCFRTYNLVGTEKQVWNEQYPVICTVAEDAEIAGSIASLGDHLFAGIGKEAVPYRSFLLFGYQGNGEWVWLGIQKEPTFTFKSFDEAQQDREQISKQYGAPIWDAEWLQTTYGLAMKPFPENWRAGIDDKTAMQAILDAIRADEKQETQP